MRMIVARSGNGELENHPRGCAPWPPGGTVILSGKVVTLVELVEGSNEDKE